MRLSGISFPSEGPFLFSIRPHASRFTLNTSRFTSRVQRKSRSRARLNLRNRCHRLYAPQHRNPRLPEHVLDFGFPQPRSVILECQPVGLFMHAETAQPIGIGKPSQRSQLIGQQRRLQFVGNLHECHARIIAADGNGPAALHRGYSIRGHGPAFEVKDL
jgi:hypothetical protein